MPPACFLRPAGRRPVRILSPQQKTEPRHTAQLGFWWGMVDSNHRRRCQQIYSLSPLATREIPHIRLQLVDGFAFLRESHGGYNVPPARCQEPPFESVRKRMRNPGAGGRIRTPDLLITNQLLYQLSYTSI